MSAIRRATAILIAGWLLAIPLCIAVVDRPAARFAHDVIGKHEIARRMTLMPQLLAPLCLVLLAGLGLAALRTPLRGTARLLLFAALSLVVSDAMGMFLKTAFGRAWPETWTGNNPSFIGNHVFGFFPFHGGTGWASFPSGHMVAICGFCGVFWFAAPRWRPVWITLMVLPAIGLYLQDYHFVSDLVAGAGLGMAVSAVTVRLGGLRASAYR